MVKHLLVTRPDHDMVMIYLAAWSKIAIDSAEEHGYTIIKLDGKNATKETFESYVTKVPTIRFIVFNGHGDSSTVAGQDDKPIVKVGDNEHLLLTKVVYSISCSSANLLGKQSVERGARSYIGYDNDFTFAYDNNKMTTPLNDGLAKLFLDHSSIFISTVVKGNTIGEAHERARRNLYENFSKVIAEGLQNLTIASWLWLDYQAFVVQGDKDIRL